MIKEFKAQRFFYPNDSYFRSLYKAIRYGWFVRF